MTVHTRRGFFKSVSATAATAALPATALAYQGPVTETPEPKLPDWWERLVAEVEGLRSDTAKHFGYHEYLAVSQERLDAIFAALDDAGRDLSPEAQIMHHAREIKRVMRDTAPEGSTLKGFQFRTLYDEIDLDTVWASAMTDQYQLAHMRPSMFDGWRVAETRIVGGSV